MLVSLDGTRPLMSVYDVMKGAWRGAISEERCTGL